MSKLVSKPPPPRGSAWERIEQAREALGWGERELGIKALGNPSGYTAISGRNGWNSRTDTQDAIIGRLVAEGYSDAWLRAGVLPEQSNGRPLPERKNVLEQLAALSRRLGRPSEEILGLWVERGAGPLEKLPDLIQRAAFAAAYLDGRSLEDVRLAVREAQKVLTRGAGVNDWLHHIRQALGHIKPGSGTHRGLSLLPQKAD